MPKRRLGVALLVPQPAAAEIDGLRRALGDGALGRIPAHLTLVPPVNVRDDRMPDALAVLRAAAAATRPLRLRLGPPATFLPVNPVGYLGVDGDGDGVAELFALRDRVFKEPLARPLTWPFVPHVTVVDDAAPTRLEAAVTALASYDVEVEFRRVHLLEEGQQRVWRPVADFAFEEPSVIGRGGLEFTIETGHGLDPGAEEWTAAAWRRYSIADYGTGDDDRPFALTARRAAALLGTATGSTRGDDSYLARLIVDETERGMGVGSHLLTAAESLARERGAARMTLRTQAEGAARAFYERRGWTVQAVLPAWRHGRDFVQMERRLT